VAKQEWESPSTYDPTKKPKRGEKATELGRLMCDQLVLFHFEEPRKKIKGERIQTPKNL